MSLIIVDEAAELKLSALQPAAVFDFVSITEGEE